MQTQLAGNVPIANIPALTKDALALLIEEALVRAGVSEGASTDEIEAAINQLIADGYVVHARENAAAFVITQPT